MAKVKRRYFCQNCGTESAKWQGKCSGCGEWNTYVEEVLDKQKKDRDTLGIVVNKLGPEPLKDINFNEEQRIKSSDQELNRVLGGGIVKGSVVLIGGEPGIGKSTLMLHLAIDLSERKVVYVSGEESARQIKMRADRLTEKILPSTLVLIDTDTASIFHHLNNVKPDIVIVDSIQTLSSPLVESTPGSVSQVRQCTSELIRYAKEHHTPVFLVGHITKDGTLAGPKVLEHMADTVLQFEGDRHMTYRLLRTKKNRFGSTSEIGIYEMLVNGLRQVSNPSEILLSQRNEELSGIAIGVTMEGNRPLLIEIQALVSTASYGTPQRSATGFDNKRLQMLLAVLEKRCGYRLSQQDVFVNVAGGLKVEDPAIDLAVCMSIISSYENIVLPNDICFSSEIGLGGETRAVNHITNRVSEASKLGFQKIIISEGNSKGLKNNDKGIDCISVKNITEVIQIIS